MKLYDKTNLKTLIRLQICRQGDPIQYITLEDTTAPDVEAMCRSLIESQNLSVFLKGLRTSINIREFLGADARKSKSISFRGLDTKQVFDLIINHVNSL